MRADAAGGRPAGRTGDPREPHACNRAGLHNCEALGRWTNYDATRDPCMSCGEDRLDPAPERCRQPGGHWRP